MIKSRLFSLDFSLLIKYILTIIKINTKKEIIMTIKELYEWAVQNGVENLPAYYNEDGACNLVCDVFVEDAHGNKMVVMY